MKTMTFNENELKLLTNLVNVHEDVCSDNVNDDFNHLKNVIDSTNENEVENAQHSLNNSLNERRAISSLSRKFNANLPSRISCLKHNDVVVVLFFYSFDKDDEASEMMTTHVHGNNLSDEKILNFLYEKFNDYDTIVIGEIFR